MQIAGPDPATTCCPNDGQAIAPLHLSDIDFKNIIADLRVTRTERDKLLRKLKGFVDMWEAQRDNPAIGAELMIFFIQARALLREMGVE